MESLAGAQPESAWQARWRPVLGPVAVAAAAKVAVLLLTWLLLERPDWFLDRLATAWDGSHYLLIAREGYQNDGQGPGGSVAFAFLYPALIRLAGGSQAAALAINNVASLAAVAVVAWQFGRKWALFLALFPSWLVFGTVAYSEGLYVLLAAAGLAFLERRRHVLAGVLGSLAASARYMGGPAFLLAAVPWRRPRSWRNAATLGLVALTGLGIWIFLWQATGSFFGYGEAQTPWGSELAWPWEHVSWLLHGWFTTQFGTIPDGNLDPLDAALRDGLFLIPAVWGLCLLWRRPDGTGLFAYSLTLVVLAACTTGIPAAAFPRYLLAAFPAIAIVGERLTSRAAWFAYAAAGVLLGTHGLSHHLAGYWS